MPRREPLKLMNSPSKIPIAVGHLHTCIYFQFDPVCQATKPKGFDSPLRLAVRHDDASAKLAPVAAPPMLVEPHYASAQAQHTAGDSKARTSVGKGTLAKIHKFDSTFSSFRKCCNPCPQAHIGPAGE